MNVQDKFLQLTQFIHYYGSEEQMDTLLPEDIQQDEVGNYFIEIGKSESIFTAHLDTVCEQDVVEVNHIVEEINGNVIIRTDGNTILGADDRAGVLVLLHMIEHRIPGLYYFFIGEEVGRIGSRGIAESTPEMFRRYERCISFDRKGLGSVITSQMGETCCSQTFAQALTSELAQHTGHVFFCDNNGSYTDSYSFNDLIPNCTNISVGYFDQHSVSEYINITYLVKLCKAVTEIRWEELPSDWQRLIA